MAWTKATKKAHSERMKAFWAKRRANGNTSRNGKHAPAPLAVKVTSQLHLAGFLTDVETVSDADLTRMGHIIAREIVYRQHAKI